MPKQSLAAYFSVPQGKAIHQLAETFKAFMFKIAINIEENRVEHSQDHSIVYLPNISHMMSEKQFHRLRHALTTAFMTGNNPLAN